jgi:hypothetical protein
VRACASERARERESERERSLLSACSFSDTGLPVDFCLVSMLDIHSLSQEHVKAIASGKALARAQAAQAQAAAVGGGKEGDEGR